jgi:site-specific DNA-methyltransferase (adenine-specific)
MSRRTYSLTEHRTVHILREDGGRYQVSPEPKRPGDAVICGDATQVLEVLPEHSVQVVVTSPPYYKQRDYKSDGQLGHEPTPEEYVRRLAGIITACRRVLKPDGLLWLNLGDKYLGGRLLGLPWRVALALTESGWILRSDVIWHKPNAMPASITNRPTTDHEYVFMLSRGPDYFYNADAIREPHVTFTDASQMKGGRGHFGKAGGTPERGKNKGNPNLHRGRWDQAFHPLGRNKRTVWSIPLSKFPEAHFAVFPEKLVENCILASTNPGDTVLDPFCGSGTTLLVAHRLRRHFVGIDVQKDYCEMALRRLNMAQQELPFAEGKSQEVG